MIRVQEESTIAAVRETLRLVKMVKPVAGTEADDIAIIDEVDSLRQKALDLLLRYLD